ncbi:hypothetical protein H1C71_031631 [Ictidomys tridecemlineatus]|uniref:interferon-activable protein 203-like n=1 Tax=Ictidomys tridecemlineatus TaxID=43179 RepID=UPI00038C0283|nr:interferon-activable protein 203-like [Ictidomys tridecemlineatus]XP_040143182.1 interferon-activable protein 203-like [Ictidomys tridecemlineatus]KAG3281014.1 hypothetical protein H1C71_031631 [Ictidomys tridecemlineatus]
MVNEYKKIVLLVGLEAIKDYEFRLIKSLLAKDLKLTRNMQEDYDRIRIADLMEEKFHRDAGLGKLITLCKDIPALAELAEILKTRRLKVKRKSKGGRKSTGEKKSTGKKVEQDESPTAQSRSTTNTDSEPESEEELPSSKENEIKNSEDPERTQLPPEQGRFMEPSATSKEQTAVCPQTPHGPPPEPSNSPPIERPDIEKSVSLVNEQEKIALNLQDGHVRAQEMDNTNTQTHDNMEVQESQGQRQLPELSSFATQTTASMFHTFKMAPRTPSCSFQTLQVTPTEPSTRIQTLQNPGLTMIPTEASEERGHQKGPKEVVVLKVTEPFIYEFKEGGKKMFHATVATESEFFRVKVFDFHLKAKFIPKTVIAISDYIGSNGFLEIHSASSVSHVSADRKMEISSRLIKNANATPKIEYLCSQCTVKYVNGVYTVYKKDMREDCTYYGIRDDTGNMEVVVYGWMTYVNCEEGDKINLFCFELAFNEDKWQLRSVRHSYIKVIKARRFSRGQLNCNSNMNTSQESS